MNNLRLIPDTHRHEPIEKASFTYDRELIALVKAQKGARWSQTLRSWYFLTKEFMINYRVQNIYDYSSGKIKSGRSKPSFKRLR